MNKSNSRDIYFLQAVRSNKIAIVKKNTLSLLKAIKNQAIKFKNVLQIKSSKRSTYLIISFLYIEREKRNNYFMYCVQDTLTVFIYNPLLPVKNTARKILEPMICQPSGKASGCRCHPSENCLETQASCWAILVICYCYVLVLGSVDKKKK